MSEYITTDGRFSLREKNYECLKHGPQSMIGVNVSIAGTDDDVNINYCIRCFVEMLDEKCCRLKEVRK